MRSGSASIWVSTQPCKLLHQNFIPAFQYTQHHELKISQLLTIESQFLQRSRVLSFYRTIIRGTRSIADPATRRETQGFARAEFERHREVTDLVSPSLLSIFTFSSPLYIPLSLCTNMCTILTGNSHISATSSQQGRQSGITWRGTSAGCNTIRMHVRRSRLGWNV